MGCSNSNQNGNTSQPKTIRESMRKKQGLNEETEAQCYKEVVETLEKQTELCWGRRVDGVRAHKKIFYVRPEVADFQNLIGERNISHTRVFEIESTSQTDESFGVGAEFSIGPELKMLFSKLTANANAKNYHLEKKLKSFAKKEHIFVRYEVDLKSFRIEYPEFTNFFTKSVTRDTLKDFYTTYGQIVPRQVHIGGKISFVEEKQASQELNQKLRGFAGNFGPAGGVNFGAQVESSSNSDIKNAWNRSNKEVIGGDITKLDFEEWVSSLSNKAIIKTVEIMGFEYTHDLLPLPYKDQILKILEEMEKESNTIRTGMTFTLKNAQTQSFVGVPRIRKGCPGGISSEIPGKHQICIEGPENHLMNNSIVQILTLETPIPEHNTLYSSEAGAIYYDKRRYAVDTNMKQCWIVLKVANAEEDPTVRFGDEVQLANVNWPDADLVIEDGGRLACEYRNKPFQTRTWIFTACE